MIANPAGDRVYCTNRGDDTLAVFALSRDQLKLLQTVRSGGASPRFLCLVEDSGLLLVGHEDDSPVQALSIGPGGELVHIGPAIPLENVAWLQQCPPWAD